MKIKISEEAGFTLVEAMIAMSILAVGLLGVIGMFTTSIGGNAFGGNMTQAATLAQEKLEDLRIEPYPNITTDNTGEQISLNGKTYTRKWTVSQDFSLKLKTITVDVSWTTKGQTRTAKLITKRAYDR